MLDFEPKKSLLEQNLNRLGIPFAENPALVPKPSEWLVRGVSDSWVWDNQTYFEPRQGDMGSYGVFLGDNLSVLMFPGTYFVYRTQKISPSWVFYPSPMADEKIKEIVQTNGLNLKTFDGQLSAEHDLFYRNCVLQPGRGIYTIPRPLAISDAECVLVEPWILRRCQDRIPNNFPVPIVEMKPVN
jgi:hypothetical protein